MTTYYNADSMNSQYAIGTLATKAISFKDCSVAIMEVPTGAKAFTTKIEMEKNAENKEVPVVYIMTDNVDKDIHIFNEGFVSVSKRLFAYFGRVKYNFAGYYIKDEAAEKYGVPSGTIWIHDIYINSNFIDFPLFTRIMTNAGLKILPVVNIMKFSEESAKSVIGTPSMINPKETIEEIFIRRRIEDLEGSVSTYSRAACLYKKPIINVPAIIKEEIPLLPFAETETEEEVSQTEIDRILEDINGEKEEKPVSKKIEMLKEFVKDTFDFYIESKTMAEELTIRKVELKKENYYLILSYIKSKFLNYILLDKDYQESNQKEFRFYFIDKIITDVAKDFIKENLKV